MRYNVTAATASVELWSELRRAAGQLRPQTVAASKNFSAGNRVVAELGPGMAMATPIFPPPPSGQLKWHRIRLNFGGINSRVREVKLQLN